MQRGEVLGWVMDRWGEMLQDLWNRTYLVRATEYDFLLRRFDLLVVLRRRVPESECFARHCMFYADR